MYLDLDNDDDLFEEEGPKTSSKDGVSSEELAYGHPIDGVTHCPRCDRVHMENMKSYGIGQAHSFANKIGQNNVQQFLDLVDEIGHLHMGSIIASSFANVVSEAKAEIPLMASAITTVEVMKAIHGDKYHLAIRKNRFEAEIYETYELLDTVTLEQNSHDKTEEFILEVTQYQALIMANHLESLKRDYFEFCQENDLIVNEDIVENKSEMKQLYANLLGTQ